MKTQSIKSIATLLGVVVALNVSALAGPDLQLLSSLRRINETQERNVNDHKNVVFVATRQDDGKDVKSTTQSRSVTFYPGSHGGIVIR